ncbi:MAG: 4Fe-4S dicluster domain-containing protein [Planctomycetes bacterium]|nr:4Fe-4S dicluster domain-containing protein [Planctomycetota bacterium]
MNPQEQINSKQYWRSAAERNGHVEQPPLPGVTRRDFLEAAGFALSLATLSGCDRAPVQYALPLANQPEGVRPARMRYFASTCGGCAAGCGLLAGVRDGRPLKMEGMPEHPLSRGGLCAVGQAQTLGLYDSHRLKGPLKDGKNTTWKEVDDQVAAELRDLAQAGGAVRVVTSTITSPTLQQAIDRFLKQFADGRHVVFDPVSASAILDSHEQTHGIRVLPRYLLDKAKFIVSLDADFLGAWIAPVEFTAAWKKWRELPRQASRNDHAEGVPTEEHAKPEVDMSYHVQFEPRMTLTGSNADRRIRLRPDEFGLVLSHLLQLVAKHAGKDIAADQLAEPPVAPAELQAIADGLWQHRGKSLVLCGVNDVEVQVLVNHLNHLLDNYGPTLDVQHPSRQRQSDDRAVEQLVTDLKADQVAAILSVGVDLTYNLPPDAALHDAIKRVPLKISLAERHDDFSKRARYVCPDHHPLESWLDAEPVAGLFSIRQPMINPMGNTRSALESFAAWSGNQIQPLDVLRAYWRDNIFPRQQEVTDFTRFWDRAVHDGFVQIATATTTLVFQKDTAKLVSQAAPLDGLFLLLYSKVAIPDSRHAHNPWLQELPDPVTKVTWDNYAAVSPALARKQGLVDNDVVRLSVDEGNAIELPVHVQPGQHDQVVGVALGYGVPGTDRFAAIGPQWIQSRPTVGENSLVGVNAAPLVKLADGSMQYVRSGVRLEKTGRRHTLATTQLHDSIEVPASTRPPGSHGRGVLVQETTLNEYRGNPSAGAPKEHPFADQLWSDDHPYPGHRWGMVIDLNACTGCSACLIACQSENNVPVVGRDEVHRHREMHWIRLDRYYSGSESEPDVIHQPMMCQHCANAPCETVCPVLATVHSNEGLNQQVYNRCVGTRYCANNCPYKVRRFNWFNYAHDDTLENMALNPDVTVRVRGIMEKCSMCVQRIQEGRIESRRLGQSLADGSIQTACQQSCPAGAILFGDLNDPESRVAQAMNDARRFRVLEELNVQPAVAYLRKVRNATKEEQGV